MGEYAEMEIDKHIGDWNGEIFSEYPYEDDDDEELPLFSC